MIDVNALLFDLRFRRDQLEQAIVCLELAFGQRTRRGRPRKRQNADRYVEDALDSKNKSHQTCS